MKRRLLLAGIGAGAAALALRPGVSGAPHGAYFSALARALRRSDRATDATTAAFVLVPAALRSMLRRHH